MCAQKGIPPELKGIRKAYREEIFRSSCQIAAKRFSIASRGTIEALSCTPCSGAGEGLPVELSVWSYRQRIQYHERGKVPYSRANWF